MFDKTYLNRTANKWPRTGYGMPEMIIWHETASPNPDNPFGTLDYNLPASVGSSYHYLIARDGRIFHYLDERQWIAYHAGLHSSARGYIEWGVNVRSIGVELDGRNDGTPITPAQRDSIIQLMLFFEREYDIPLHHEYHLAHRSVAPGYKSDPKGFSIDVALRLTQRIQLWHYRVVVSVAVIRQGPGTYFPRAGTMRRGELLVADKVIRGQQVGTSDLWAHRADELGFVHLGALKAA